MLFPEHVFLNLFFPTARPALGLPGGRQEGLPRWPPPPVLTPSPGSLGNLSGLPLPIPPWLRPYSQAL